MSQRFYRRPYLELHTLIETDALTKRYGAMTALDQCSVQIQRGEVFGLLGPNGAGKTTLIRLLLGFLKPTSGIATIDGLDCYAQSVKVHEQVAYLPGEPRLFPAMRAREVLRFFADIRPTGDFERSLQVAERLELDLSRQVAYMSTGMKQKAAIAATVASETPLLILDEPTANLDPTVRSVVMDLVAEAQQAGRTVIFSSHVLPEVEQVCDRVAILRAGKLVHTQRMSELRRQHRIQAKIEGDIPTSPDHLADQVTITTHGNQVTIESPGELSTLLGWLATLNLNEVAVEPIGLRAVYDKFHMSTNESAT